MTTKFRRSRWHAIAGLGLAAALALSACTTPNNPDAGGGDEQVLTVGVKNDLDNQFPWKTTDFNTTKILDLVYDSLTAFDDDLNVVPALAESWDISDDGLTVTFHLRDGVTYTDGSPMDSEDVKASLETIQLEATAAVARANILGITAIDAPDPLTVELALNAPDAALLANLASINMAILSSEDTEQTLVDQANGTGPFQLSDRVPNESITLSRNDAYWGDAPPLSELEFRVIPDESSIVSALQAGSIQFAELQDVVNADTATAAGLTVASTPQLSYYAIQFRAVAAPLDDLNVRLAIQCAVDRQEVIDTAALGAGTVSGPITSPAYLSDPDARPCPTRDVEQAKEYLSQSAYPDGVSLELMAINEPAFVNIVQNLQSQLEEAGITVTLDAQERGTYIDRWIAGDFVAAVARNGGNPDPDAMYSRYFTSTGNFQNVAGYSSPELDALFAEGRQTSDPAERTGIYADISSHLEDNAVWVWLFAEDAFTATAANVSGYTPLANGSFQNLAVTSVGG